MNFFSRLEDHGASVALVDEAGTQTSYTELVAAADAQAEALHGAKLVFIVARNTTTSIVQYIACLRHGITAALIDGDVEASVLDGLIRAYKPAYVLRHDQPALKNSEVADYAVHPELALLLSTSGSTGSRKFVRLSLRNVLANAASIIEALEPLADDRAITTLPTAYSYGLSIINTHLSVGATIVLNERSVMQKPFWLSMKEHKVTTFGGVPYTYQMLDRLRFGSMDLPDIRYLTQAGGRLPPEVADKFRSLGAEKGWRFIMMYGQTEATARMSWVPWSLLQQNTDTIGYPIPGGTFRLEGEAGETIESDNTTGELVYEGANVSLGYAESCDDLGDDDDNRGVLHTGDLAQRMAGGCYRIVGRKNRFLKLFGNRINLDEAERLVADRFGECACVGTDERMQIYLTTAVDVEQVRKEMASSLHVHMSALKVNHIERIPRTENGKISYAELQQAMDDD